MFSRQSDGATRHLTSDRKQRLWACTVTVLAAIYSTLGLGTTLVEVLRNRNLFDRTVIASFPSFWPPS